MQFKTILLASGIMGVGDIISQKIEKRPVDYKRCAKMAMIGGFTNGVCLTLWYRQIDKVFKHQKHMVLKKMIADQTIYAPASILFYLGVTSNHIGSMDEYRKICDQKFFDIWKADCCVWPVSNYINFSYMHLRYQPIFTSFVDVGWNTYISYKTHN